MGVIMQAAEFVDVTAAAAWEAELRALREAFVRFERTDPAPWSMAVVPEPLAAMAARRGLEWPLSDRTRFLVRGSLADTEILRVDRLVLFWGDGFELGGATLAEIARSDGATRTAAGCHLRVRADDPEARAAALGAFLDEEDHAGRYRVEGGAGPVPGDAIHTITFEGPGGAARLVFDGSGMQDWAFVAAAPQLDGEDPRLA